jgi:hypothetical protein
MFTNHFSPAIVSGLHPVQVRQVRLLQNRLLDTPEDFLYHIRQCVISLHLGGYFIHCASFVSAVGSIILAVTYGIQVKEINDPYIEIAENVTKTFSQLGPGKYLVDVLPVRTCMCCPAVIMC